MKKKKQNGGRGAGAAAAATAAADDDDDDDETQSFLPWNFRSCNKLLPISTAQNALNANEINC